MTTGDDYKRREVAPGVYQCGCRWIRTREYGDVLQQCPIHQQHTDADVRKFERERQKIDECKHTKVQPKFNIEEAEGLTSYEVRKRWPRFHGICPDCGQYLILYASFEHYVSGDW